MKILKKSLAIFLTLALCLSAMLGCLSVSAEGTDPALTIVLGKDTYAPGETFDVAVYVENFADIKGAEFTVDFGALTVGEISSELITLVEDNEEVEPNIYVNGSTVKFVDTFSEIASGNLLVVSVTAPAEVGNVEVTVSNAKFGLNATELADVTVTGATVVVEEAVVECPHENTTTTEVVTTPATCTTAGTKTVTVTCDACGETVSTTTVEIPATGHTEGTLVSATPATGTGSSTTNNVEETKGSVTFVCATCGEEFTQEVSYWNRYTFNYYNLSIASQIELVFNLRTSRLTETAGDVQDVFVKAVTAAETEDVTTYVTGVLDLDNVIQSGNPCKPVAVGVPAKQLVDVITATAFVKRDGVWYSGTPKVRSVEEQVHAMYDLVEDAEKALYANLLVFGSKAQTYFSYRLDQLADANIGNYAAYVTETNPTLVNDTNNAYTDPCIRTTTQSMSVAAKTEARITFRADKLDPIPAAEEITVKATYADGDAVVEKIYGSDVFAPEGRENRYIVNIDSVYPKYMRKAVTVKFLANGVETNSTFTFSIAGLCQKVIETTSGLSQAEIDLYYAMINYADAAAAYFGVAI